MTFKPEYVALVDSMGSDLRVVNAAKVSFNKESEWAYEVVEFDEDDNSIPTGERALYEKDEKLIGYLAKHSHWSPFAHCMVTLRIKMPFFIYMQWEKHKIAFGRSDDFVINMISRRYVSYEPEFWVTETWRGKPVNAKQGSSDVIIADEQHEQNMVDLRELSLKTYNHALEVGICPEQARESLILDGFTEWYETASLAAYARIVKQRATKDAQSEIRDYANRVSEIMAELFPVSWKALMEN